MCAIIDANVAHEAFGEDARTPAGKKFLRSVDEGRLVLVAGGKLLEELDKDLRFQEWREEAVQNGTIRMVDTEKVQLKTMALRNAGTCESDDQHVVALAQVSGARLLFSNDEALQRDFKNKSLVDGPRGKVYTTRTTKSVTRSHRSLLADRTLCTASG